MLSKSSNLILDLALYLGVSMSSFSVTDIPLLSVKLLLATHPLC